jgi:hyperosmotically inducible protein
MQKHLLKYKAMQSRAAATIAAYAISCASFQVLAFGTENDIEQTPLVSEFKKLDINHDSKLSREEAAQDKDLVGKFAQADSNKDGVLNAKEYGNFKSAVQQKRVGTFLNDSTVTAKVKAELLKDVGMKGMEISVETYKGQVILSGFVETDQQIHRAVEIASGVRGVQSVKNSLVVKG